MSPLHSLESLQVCSFQTCVWNQNGTKAPLNAANKTAQIVIYLQIRGSNAGFVFTSTTLNLNVRIYTKYNQIKENGLLNGYQHRWLKSMQPSTTRRPAAAGLFSGGVQTLRGGLRFPASLWVINLLGLRGPPLIGPNVLINILSRCSAAHTS